MAHFVHGSSGRPKALPSFVISPPRSTPARASTSVSSTPRPPTSCSDITSGSNRALTLYEGRITGRGGAKQSFHCTDSAGLSSSLSLSSSSSSKFDPARLDCLRRHEALRRKREENVQVVRAREDMARNFKARPLPHIHRGASFVEPERTIGDDDRHSAFSPRIFVSSSFFGSSPAEGVGGGSPSSSSSSRYCPSGASSTLTSTWRRKASSSHTADSECMSPQCPDNEEDFGRSTYIFEDGVGLLQRQREWADSRERRLEAARAVKAVEELAELRPMPDLAEARSSWEKAKAEHEAARLRALERDKERQDLEALKQKVIRKRYQGMYGQGEPRRVEHEGGVQRLQLPRAQPSEEGHDQRRRRSPSHSLFRSAQTGGAVRDEGGEDKREQTESPRPFEDRTFGGHHTTALTVAPRLLPSPFHAILAASCPAPSTPPRHTPTPTTPSGASSFFFTSSSRALDMYRSPSNRQHCSSSSPSSSPPRNGHRTPSRRSSPLPSKHFGTHGSSNVGSTAVSSSQLPSSPPPPPPLSHELLPESPLENDNESWRKMLATLDLGGDLGKLYAEVGHDLATLLHDQDARTGDRSIYRQGKSSDAVLQRWSSSDSTSSSSCSSASLGRSWERTMVLEEDLLLAHILNHVGDGEGEEEKEEENEH